MKVIWNFRKSIGHADLRLYKGCSMTQAFFIVMGGFHLFQRGSKETSHNATDIFVFRETEDDVPLHPLSSRDLYNNATVDFDFSSLTVPTEDEIKDKGKSDWLAKSLVLLQTSWFVMQCIARAVEHLPVTHLEIVTLAYAAMNLVIYIFWWNKPLNVNRPVRVFRKSDPITSDHGSESESESAPVAERSTSEKITIFILGGQDEFVNLSLEAKIPRFWACSTAKDVAIADIIVLGVGVCFGAIHCIAWSFSFPTYAELSIWRISCVAITSVPVYAPLIFFLSQKLSRMGYGALYFWGPLSGGILYILARAATLVLAFSSLRDLPPGVYETVHWTTFIPHV